jgi:hypothetical protein
MCWESEGNCVRRDCNNNNNIIIKVNYKEIQNEDVALAVLDNNIVEPSGDRVMSTVSYYIMLNICM